VSLLDDARALAAVDPIDDVGFNATAYTCFWCSPPDRLESKHAANCPWLSLPKIVAALALVEKYGIMLEEQDDGLHLISRPKRQRLISERAVRVMEAAQEVVDMYPDDEPWYEESGMYVFCDGAPGKGHSPGCQWLTLQAAMKGEVVPQA
jgi:hypothetical protein